MFHRINIKLSSIKISVILQNSSNKWLQYYASNNHIIEITWYSIQMNRIIHVERNFLKKILFQFVLLKTYITTWIHHLRISLFVHIHFVLKSRARCTMHTNYLETIFSQIYASIHILYHTILCIWRWATIQYVFSTARN